MLVVDCGQDEGAGIGRVLHGAFAPAQRLLIVLVDREIAASAFDQRQDLMQPVLVRDIGVDRRMVVHRFAVIDRSVPDFRHGLIDIADRRLLEALGPAGIGRLQQGTGQAQIGQRLGVMRMGLRQGRRCGQAKRQTGDQGGTE